MMWEDPRPERLRELENRRRSPVVATLAGIAVFAVLAAFIFKAGLVPWPAPEPTPSAEPPPAPITAPRPGAQPSPPASSPVERTAPPAQTRRSGDPNVLRQLTETCRYWTQQNTRGQYAGYQRVACDEVARYAKDFNMTLQPAATSPRQNQPAMAPSAATTRLNVNVDQCERHGYGTIGYRQCRANEKNRLTALCHNLRTQRQSAQGALYEALGQRAQATCREADLYEIVR